MSKKTSILSESQFRAFIVEAVSNTLCEIGLQDYLPQGTGRTAYSDFDYDDPFTAASSRDENDFADRYFGMRYDEPGADCDELDALGRAHYLLQRTNNNGFEKNYADYPNLKKAEMDSDWADLDAASDALGDELYDMQDMYQTVDSDNSDPDKSEYFNDSYNGIGDLNSWYAKNENKKRVDRLVEEACESIFG